MFYTLSELSVYKDLNDWRLDIIAFIGEFFFSLFYRDSIMGDWEDLEWFSLGRIHQFEVEYLAPRAL